MKVLFKMVVSLGLITLLLAYSGCEEECGEDVLLGDLSLSTTTRDFLPYRGGQVLVFEDSLGNELLLNSTNGLSASTNQLTFQSLCFQRFVSSQSTFYNAEFRNIQFANNDSTIAFDLSLEFETFSEDFDDAERIFLFQSLQVDQNTLGGLFIVTDKQNDFPAIDLERIEEGTILLDSLTLFNKTYLNVYRNAFQDPPTLYYNKEFGIVAFTDSQQVKYVLKEIRN